MVPAVADAAPVRQFAGLRHVSSTGDFIVRPSVRGDRLYLAAGIRSTGISTSPAVAEAVVDDVLRRRRWTNARPPQSLRAPVVELPEEPGEIVCLCRSISRGELIAATRQPIEPITLDAMKRRGGATFGDCQGNLCGLDVARIIADRRGAPIDTIEKHRRGSWLWEAVEPSSSADASEPSRVIATDAAITGTSWAVVVVGAGAAGQAAARAAAEGSSQPVLLIERARTPVVGRSGAAPTRLTEATVVGISPGEAGWLVLAQSATGTSEISARNVVVATGAYVQPREHRAIGGSRPAGVMTSDLAWRLLAAGLRPGRTVAVVGNTPPADGLAAALEAAGAAVLRLVDPPTEVAGELRVQAVRIGDRWVQVDTLVLADRLVPQAFVLRGLGLIDAQPGTAILADDEGRLPLDGLWATGCCVEPTFDHMICAKRGRAVGARVGALVSARSRSAS